MFFFVFEKKLKYRETKWGRTSDMGGACSEPECSGAESGPCGFGTDEVVEYGVGIAFARDSTVDTERVDKFSSWSSDLKLLC